jgi:hypothetical protein
MASSTHTQCLAANRIKSTAHMQHMYSLFKGTSFAGVCKQAVHCIRLHQLGLLPVALAGALHSREVPHS